MDRRTLERPVQADNLRGLKALVIGMGVLIVLGTSLVIGLVIKRLYAAGSAPAKAALPASLRLPAPQGATIAGIATVDGRLAIWVKDGPGKNRGGKVMLIDPSTDSVTGSVSLQAK